jgi:hypothetical protein
LRQTALTHLGGDGVGVYLGGGFLRMTENRVEMLARQHSIQQKRDDGGVKKTFMAFVRRADEGTLSRLVVEANI